MLDEQDLIQFFSEWLQLSIAKNIHVEMAYQLQNPERKQIVERKKNMYCLCYDCYLHYR